MEGKSHDQMILKFIQMEKYQRKTRKSLKRSNKLEINDCGAVPLNSKENCFQPGFLCPTKLLTKSEGTKEKFSYMNASRKYVSPHPFLRSKPMEVL